MLKHRIVAPTTTFTYECSDPRRSFTIVKETMHVKCMDGSEYHEPGIWHDVSTGLVPLTQHQRATAEIDMVAYPALDTLYGNQPYLRIVIPIDGEAICVYFKPC